MTCEPNVDSDFWEFPICPLDVVLSQEGIGVLMVDYDEFKVVNRDVLKKKIIIDTRGVWR